MAGRSINRVEILGNLTRDPELKYTPTGAAVCTFGVATNRSWNTQDGQTKEDVQYHRVVAWNKLAELCGKLLAKGKKVYCVGRLSYRSFIGKDGAQRNITEIVLDDFIVLSDGKRIQTGEEEVAAEEPKTAKSESVEEEIPQEEQADEKSESKKKKGKEKSEEDETINPEDIPF